MSKLKNTIIPHNEYVEIICETIDYKHSILLDTIEDIKSTIRVSKEGYAYYCIPRKKSLKGNFVYSSLSNDIMNHKQNKAYVIDHKNGNRLDNRRSNLRKISFSENCLNKNKFIRNNTGVVGISYRQNGKYEYYRVSLVDRSKTPITREYHSKKLKQYPRYSKQFNINKLGRSKAFIMATEHLKKMKIELCYPD